MNLVGCAVAVSLSALVGHAVAPAPAASACGSERWATKTLQDRPALHLRARTVTVAQLGALPNGASMYGPRVPAELQVYRIVGVTLDRFKLETDGDVHLGVTQGGAHMIVEFPATECLSNLGRPDTMLDGRVEAARAALVAACGQPPPGQIHSTALHGGTATITGPLFLDADHPKFPPFDHAPNYAELHPALSFRLTSARC